MSLLDPKFVYVSATATNIQATWRKFGWRPLNEMSDLRRVDNGQANQANGRPHPEIKDVRQ